MEIINLALANCLKSRRECSQMHSNSEVSVCFVAKRSCKKKKKKKLQTTLLADQSLTFKSSGWIISRVSLKNMAYTSLPGQMGNIKKSVSLNYGCLDLAAQIPMLTRPVVLMNRGKNGHWLPRGNPPPPPCSHMCKVHVTRGTAANSLGVCTQMNRLIEAAGN